MGWWFGLSKLKTGRNGAVKNGNRFNQRRKHTNMTNLWEIHRFTKKTCIGLKMSGPDHFLRRASGLECTEMVGDLFLA